MGDRGVKLGPFVTNEFGERYLYEVNRTAFNKVGSDALYRQIFGDELFQEDTLHIIIGTDSGLLPCYILQHGISAGSRFLFVELPHVIDRIKDTIPLAKHKNRLALVACDNWQAAAEQLELTNYIYIGKVVLRQSVGAIDANMVEYPEFHWRVSQELTQLVWATKASLGTAGFTIRQLENLAENRHSSICLKDAFAGKTAFLLGGGPSLDEALPWLKTHKNDLVILAVSRICKRLLNYGLTPHIVFSIDPNPVSFDISKELFYFWKKTLFIHAFHVSPPLLAQWRGRSLFMGPRFPWESPLSLETLPSTGPTVTNAALAAAVTMGFSMVLLAGVDLCYSRAGYSHAKGSNEHDLGPELGLSGIQVKTNGGRICETRPDYASAMEIIAGQATQAQRRGCKIINTASGAAKIPPIVYQPLDEIRVEKATERPEEIIQDRLPIDNRDIRVTYYKDALDELATGNGKLRKIRKLAQEALEYNEGLFGRDGKNANFKYKERMDKIERILNTTYKHFVPLVKGFGIKSFLRVVHVNSENEWDNDEIEKAGKQYYQSFRDSTDLLIKLVEKAQQRLRARLEEEKDSPDINLLTAQWRRDHQPGRYLIWTQRNPEAEKGARISHGAVLKELEDEFRSIIEEKETGHMRLMRKKINLSGVRGKAAGLFQKKDTDELERLAEGLTHITSSEARKLLYLTRGYLAELHGNMTQAFEEYNKLLSDETDPALLEDALQRIAVICIDNRDTENAVTALECLAQLSSTYAPQYADILRLTGDRETAAEVYSDYLQKVPDDLGTMLKLGKLYKDMRADEAAQMAFNYVLERDPDNGAARAMLQT